MQFKFIAAALASLAATSVIANPLPYPEAAQGAEIMARAEQAEQAQQAQQAQQVKQGKQFFGGPGGLGNNWGQPGFGNQNGLTAFGFGGGGVSLQGNGFNGNGGCPPQLQCWQCNGFNQGWGGGQCGWGQFQGCPCW
ncbi:hypothetical protein M409DRAFT_58560 [Zasmidium cellare ATCC 36951]|uniref:Uncharacterized protein n=1 Tax=Zasmidium cellare ATCC 36951 TaxID=1080233 RepID=A0A6A6C7D0_ZASCE|nr:uncharacterized protein M409DRAFT_58560 [Zasmidium cellare ATCC 36951]KAF2162120.1 hypothetical protein M409DRAFT_58560 [Zasmidium cellare ATCC 36951]